MLPGDLLPSIRRLEDLPRLAAALGYTPLWRELPTDCFRGVSAAAVVARQGEFEWYGLSGAREGAASRAARSLRARGIPAAVLGLEAERRHLVVAAADAPALELSLERPGQLELARLLRCAARPGELALAAAYRIAEALAGRGVDERFFAGFRRTLQNLMAALPAPMPTADRHALALLQLTRILFLYFIEAKGWLGGRPRFLRDEVDRCLSERRSLHRDLLNPVFFGTLNRPFAERSTLARRFGDIPFLNGGLFEPHPLERRWAVTLPTPVLRDAFDSLFERFHFTLVADSGEAIAPDMLGRVFEGVMEPEERHATGSYYTPAALVEAVVREALVVWLERRARVAPAEARRRLDDPDLQTRRRLREIRLLDPAVGSGAFLLGALRLLAGPDRTPGIRRTARLRGILSACLFGVDKNAAAVRLAELRLWLEVVAADPSERPAAVQPLPNLDALIRQGDSLLDPTAGLPLRPPAKSNGAELARLRGAVLRATGAEKRAALAALRRTERNLAEAMLRGALEATDHELSELLDAARSPTLFGERRGLPATDRAQLTELRSRRRRVRERLRALLRSGEVPWFHYPTHFADVLAPERGGFDLVVGNPPWVRAEALEPALRRYLGERFRWFRGVRAGPRSYAHLPDLAVAFLERALQLSAPEGVVALLVPAKLATAGYATAMREELTRRTTIAVAAELREESRAFDATVYPMALVLRRAPAGGHHRVRLGLGADATQVPQRELNGSPWVLLADPARAALRRLRHDFPPLGARFRCQLGVKTGLNRVFLDPPAELEPELVRWAVRGRDVGAFRVRPVRRLLWACDRKGQPLEVIPPLATQHLAAHTGALRRRADHAGGRPWTLFRTGPASALHRVIWADVARRLEAAPLSGERDLALIPLNSCYVLPVRHGLTALRLAAWLNSTWCRAVAAATADPASGGFARFNARVVAALPCPTALLTDERLLELARQAHAGRLSQKELDERCAELLELTAEERSALAELARARAEPGR
ncbi:MAG TPA: N-6 DNA methylase [Gemmatimonadales bacterium]|nr:N-6 DNA methylase [Gemmatimonadales bacterium]